MSRTPMPEYSTMMGTEFATIKAGSLVFWKWSGPRRPTFNVSVVMVLLLARWMASVGPGIQSAEWQF